MARSPSNSGVLRRVGDEVTLERNPEHDSCGVQVHGDADGVELEFMGSVSSGSGLFPLEAETLSDVIADKPSGGYAYIVKAQHCSTVKVRLAALNAGNLHVAIYSGMGDSMRNVTAAAMGDRPAKRSKMSRPKVAEPKSEQGKPAEAAEVKATKPVERPAEKPAADKPVKLSSPAEKGVRDQ